MMKRTLVALALAGSVAVAGAAGLVCDFSASGLTTLRIADVCVGYTLWKTGPDSFTVVCPGQTPPPGTNEMREYFNFKIFGGGH